MVEPAKPETFTSHDGLRLFARRRAGRGRTLALVVGLHDFGEHGGRLEPIASALATAGLESVIYDLRGHGRSEGLPGHLDSCAELERDVLSILAHEHGRRAELPIFGLGYGLGCLPLVTSALEPLCPLRGLLLLAPLFGFGRGLPPWRRRLVRRLAGILPRSRWGFGLRHRFDSASRASKERDLFHLDLFTRASAGWLRSVREMQLAMPGCAADLRLPILIQVGLSDRAIRKRRVLDFASECERAVVRWYPHMGHDLVRRPGAERVISDLLDWVARALG